jgi:NADPH2:quinone reductase
MNKNSVYVTSRAKIKNNAGEFQEVYSLKLKEKEISKPMPNEILVRHEYIGLNFFDIDITRGVIKQKDGFIPGIEATGVVEAVGSAVKQNFQKGDRIAYCTAKDCGAYSTYNTIDEKTGVVLPSYIQSHIATSLTLRGVFSHALLRRVFSVDNKSVILLFNPTGALGHILSQWAKHLGALVIGVISDNQNLNEKQITDDFIRKKKLSESYGCDLILNYNDADFTEKIMDFTNGVGVQIVYDSIGGQNLSKIIDAMQYCGLFVSLGQNSGIPLKISMQRVMEKSIFITRPSVFDYKASVDELRLTASEVYDLVRRGIIKPNLNKIYKFSEMIDAHEDLIFRRANFLNIVEV